MLRPQELNHPGLRLKCDRMEFAGLGFQSVALAIRAWVVRLRLQHPRFDTGA